MISTLQLNKLYQQACKIDVQAFKPGNVSIYAEGHDMTVEDFILSAKVSADPISNPNYSLGEKIYYAVKATRDAVGCNTNLGIILLCAPMIQALEKMSDLQTFRQSLSHILKSTTIEDANWTFKAITLASPAGLGSSDKADVHSEAKMTLLEAMKIAENKDRISLQYVSNFKDVFDFALLSYNASFERWDDLNWAAVTVYSALLSKYTDSHVERKHGTQHNAMLQKKMILVNNALLSASNPQQHEKMLFNLDKALKKASINPGTTADLTVATVFVFLAHKMLMLK